MFKPKPLRLLVVEDSEDDALLMQRQLRQAGYDPMMRRVSDLASLRAQLREGAWDAVLSDYFLPGLDI